ncbi:MULTISPECIES: ABC transporter ATP-binding protein [unclassified Janthinobacterium]|uniref:ABC transporter ATP-binding protein n=1 Tax=unclassified Janthinobacterium TaxID=2610881 RepID=UPI00160A3554|nr:MULTISPECIES: ABC transporter ATP-binding protein [unclassified Janthinobacterium]MBB5369231.1 NitT/TauT family transport system ATP-binding protein [Janthinobacterium sp. K2C7]MBB5381232.1 NitT/TauT family transport system ATP-binding protein [Janthinobacterium sp. K2Li3]MBB5387614.1 NitT/TauT family transport system ATP-binding protein [Janthinobacterium sp. K2E3]
MTTININAVNKVFTTGGNDVIALKDINLEIASGEFICLLGPSGCGKSTLLNAIAGFSHPSSGQILAGGKLITEPGPDRGMVFQEYALFPWMSIERNIAFGLEIAGKSAADIKERVDMLLNMLGLTEFRARYPKDLSGGMRQRVAIARVLALDSPIMLMDEPFGALDALTRRNLQDELLKIWKVFGTTIVFVTHSIEESIYLADRTIVMTYRPGTIKRDVAIDLPRPRDPSDPEFNRLKRMLGEMVMEEQQRHHNAETMASTAD